MPEYAFVVAAEDVQREARNMLGRELTPDELTQFGARLRQYLLYDQHCGFSNTIQERIALGYETEYLRYADLATSDRGYSMQNLPLLSPIGTKVEPAGIEGDIGCFFDELRKRFESENEELWHCGLLCELYANGFIDGKDFHTSAQAWDDVISSNPAVMAIVEKWRSYK